MKLSSAIFTVAALCASFPVTKSDTLRRRTEVEDKPFEPTGVESIPDDEYIVVFKSNPTTQYDASSSSSSSIEITTSVTTTFTGTAVVKTYNNVVNGFTMKLSPEALSFLEKHPEVSFVEKNAEVFAYGEQTEDLPWGLDRIDQPQGTDGSYTYEESGDGVHAYVIDTGVRSTHQEFSGRLGNGFNARQGDNRSPQPWDDCNGHGTHVASTIGGSKYGVAKGVVIHGVRVLGCGGSGSFADVIEGMDWVASEHMNNPGQKSVVNMSLGGGRSNAVNNAVQALVDRGVVVAVAAGNSNGNACNASPASAENALTVAATTISDRRAGYSNFGSCVDLFAPGSGILGASSGCDSCTATLSGTSMASPHVAGVAALLLAAEGGNPDEIRNSILDLALNDIVANVNGSPNEFLQSPSSEEPTPDTPAPTTAPETPAPTTAPETPAPTTAPETPVPTTAPETPAPTTAPETPAPTPNPTGISPFPTCRGENERCSNLGCPRFRFCCCEGFACTGTPFGRCQPE